MQCLRILLCGQNEGPPIKEMFERLGKNETLARLEKGLECLEAAAHDKANAVSDASRNKG